MRTHEVAQGAGCSVQQVRKLEAAGVLPPAPRTSSGYRRYAEAHLASVLAYQALAVGIGPGPARDVMRTLHTGENPDQALALLDAAHARLAQEREGVVLAAEAVRRIGEEPLGEVTEADALTVGELATAIGVAAPTLRHWEAEGLLRPGRTGSGARSYTPRDVRDARLVQQLRLAGYGIPAVREVLPQLIAGAGAAQTLARRSEAVDARSRALVRAAAHLDRLLDPASEC